MKEKTAFSLSFECLLRETKVKKKELADAIGVSPTVISHWLSGDYAPRESTLLKIADFFEVPLEALTQPLSSSSKKDSSIFCSSKTMQKNIAPEKIRTIIQNSGLSQKDLAAAAGITPVTLSRWLMQKREPREAELTRLAEVLQVSVDDFYGEVPDDEALSLEEWKARALRAEERLRELEDKGMDLEASSAMDAEEYLHKLRQSMRFVFNFLSQDSDFHR